MFLANYCAAKTGDDEMHFRRELFEINKLTIKDSVLQEDNYFYKIKFMQILRNALIINENHWAKNFYREVCT